MSRNPLSKDPSTHPIVRVLLSTLLLLALPCSLRAQASGSNGHTATCAINNAPPSDADIAFFRGDFKKSAELYAAAFSKDPTDRRSRELEIDSLLGQGAIDDAVKKSEAWTSASPQDAYAILTAGEVRQQEGDWPEAYALMLRALKIDPCLASAYQGLGDYETVAGFHLLARKHLALAHGLDPNDEGLTLDWIYSLGQQQSFEELGKFVQQSKSLDEKRRNALSRQLSHQEPLLKNQCELTSVSGPARIPMTPVYGRLGISYYGLEVAFNGRKRILQIDTGASGFLLTLSASAGLGLEKITASRVGGFGGQGANDTTESRAGSVRIGGLEFKDCAVTSLTNFGVLGGGHEMGERLDDQEGLIGADVFNRYLVTLDYIKHEVRLDPLPQPPSATGSNPPLDPLGGRTDPDWMMVDRYIAPTMQSWTKIYRSGHNLIMPVRINEKLPALFVIDTGSELNLMDKRAARQVTKEQESMTYIQGLSGMASVGETGKFIADFAGLRLPVSGMNSIDLSRSGGLAGFLGYPTLEQLVMHIDYRDNLVLFEAPTAAKLGKP